MFFPGVQLFGQDVHQNNCFFLQRSASILYSSYKEDAGQVPIRLRGVEGPGGDGPCKTRRPHVCTT